MAAAGTVVRFEPRGSAVDLLRSKVSEILVSGAAGTGKSVACMFKIHLLCLQVPGVRALVVRKTHSSLTASTLVTFRQKVAAEAIAAGALHYYGGSGAEPSAFRYTNGSVIVVGGLDRPSRLLSTEYDLCFVDEAIETTAEDLDTITTRLRNGRLPYQQLLMATNPGAPTHHLKQRANAGRCTILYSAHEDNPRLYDGHDWTEYGKAYLARLDTLTGPRYQRMRRGLWVSADGLIYTDFDPAVHLIDSFKPPPEFTRWMAVDFGYVNPMCIQWWAEDGEGRLYLYRELYRTHRTVDQHARQAKALVTDRNGQWTEPKPRAIICDHDAEGRAVFEREFGLSTVPAKKSVTDGLQAVQARLRPTYGGRPGLFIMRDALVEQDPELAEAKKPLCTADEITGYVWDTGNGKSPKEHPVKENDHGCLIAGTLVATDGGMTPIERIRPGDMVMTRAGRRPVIAAGMTHPSVAVYRVELSNGSTLTGTGSHPVWVSGEGWRPLNALRYSDRIVACQTAKPSDSTASLTVGTLSRKTGPTVSTSRRESLIDNAALADSTRRSGRLLTGRYPTATRYTTPTSTLSTTNRTTSPASPLPHTSRHIGVEQAPAGKRPNSRRTLNESDPSPWRGTAQQKVAHGTASTPQSSTSGIPRHVSGHATSAVPSMQRQQPTTPAASVRTSASLPGAVTAASTMSRDPAAGVTSSSSSIATPTGCTAAVYVLAVRRQSTPQPVFNLTVADQPEFFANGVLVHNCDAMRYMISQRDLGARPGIRVMR